MRRVLLGLVASSLVLAGCGSTVQVKGQASVGGDGIATGSSSQSPSGTDGTTGGSDGSAVGTPTGSVVGSTTGGRSSTTGTTGSTGTSGSTSGSSTGSTGAAVRPPSTGEATLAAVEIGAILFPDAAAAAASFGGNGEATGDQKGEFLRAVAYANAHGGIAGHRIKPVFHEVSLTSSQPYAVSEQEACTDFTQDHHVLAAVVFANVDNTFPQCLAKHHVLYLASGHWLHDAQDYAKNPNMVTPNETSTDREARAVLETMFARGTLKSGDTLGMLVADGGGGPRTVANYIQPTLKARGVKLISYLIQPPSSTADIANSVSAISSAELKMAAQNVKVVTFLCQGCHSFFMQDAESQQYYPKYVLSSFDNIGLLRGGNHSRALAGSYALSSDPLKDIGGYTHPKEFTGNPSRDLCHTIMKGYPTTDTSEAVAQLICGGILDLMAAGNAMPNVPLTGENLMLGFNNLGTSHAATLNFGTVLGPKRHDGAAAYRFMHYDASQDGFVYDNHTLHAWSS